MPLAFVVSIARAVLGTGLTLLMTGLLAFLLTKEEMPFRRIIYRITVASMYISAGLIPWYMTMVNLGLKTNFLLYILPSAVSAYYLILIKTYMESIPPALEESALIDGAGILTIFFRIITPVCMPILAAVGVFSAVAQWNAWTDNFYLVSDQNLMTLQYKLLLVLRQSEDIARQIASSAGSVSSEVLKRPISSTSIKMTITMVVSIPVILVYPFLQQYFVKGIMLGAVKG